MATAALARTKVGLGLLEALVVASIIGTVTPQALAGHDFAAHSLGPKVEASRAHLLATGQWAVIGSPEQIEDMLDGRARPQVCLATAGAADHL